MYLKYVIPFEKYSYISKIVVFSTKYILIFENKFTRLKTYSLVKKIYSLFPLKGSRIRKMFAG
jgi:hypothetical protein